MLAIVIGVLLGSLAMLKDRGVAVAYNSVSCGSGFLRWQGQSTTYDPQSGISEGWWQAEIIYASGIWNNAGANFSFQFDGGSSYDWTKIYFPFDDSIGGTSYLQTNCRFTDVDSWFNTRYSFADCPTSCAPNTYDVRTVAAHEFGHWLQLGHVDWWRFWDYDCVMWLEHGPDRTLCGHDVAGIQEIYGM
jgi:hypothetical protein